MIALMSNDIPPKDTFDIVADNLLAIEAMQAHKDDIFALIEANDCASRLSLSNQKSTALYRSIYGKNAEVAMKALRAMPLRQRQKILREQPESIAQLANEGMISAFIKKLGAQKTYRLSHGSQINAAGELATEEEIFEADKIAFEKALQNDVVQNRLQGINGRTIAIVLSMLGGELRNHWDMMAQQLPGKPLIQDGSEIDKKGLNVRYQTLLSSYKKASLDSARILPQLEDYPIDLNYFARLIKIADDNGLPSVATELMKWHKNHAHIDGSETSTTAPNRGLTISPPGRLR